MKEELDRWTWANKHHFWGAAPGTEMISEGWFHGADWGGLSLFSNELLGVDLICVPPEKKTVQLQLAEVSDMGQIHHFVVHFFVFLFNHINLQKHDSCYGESPGSHHGFPKIYPKSSKPWMTILV